MPIDWEVTLTESFVACPPEQVFAYKRAWQIIGKMARKGENHHGSLDGNEIGMERQGGDNPPASKAGARDRDG